MTKPKPLTLAAAGHIVRSLGLVLVKRNGEYIVKIAGVSIDDPRTYFTNDLDDAIGTARAMAEQIFKPRPPVA